MGVAIGYELPSDDPVSIDDKRRRRRKATAVRKNVGDPIFHGYLCTRIIQDMERDADTSKYRFSSSQVVDAHSKYLGVLVLNLVVDIGQLSELGTAINSPECSIEHKDDVLFLKERV